VGGLGVEPVQNRVIALVKNKIIFQITLTGSCYTTIAITIERFLSVGHPFFVQRNNVKARMFVVPVAVYAILYNVPRFFEFKVIKRPLSPPGGGVGQSHNGTNCQGKNLCSARDEEG
jgi:hypothetical protein